MMLKGKIQRLQTAQTLWSHISQGYNYISEKKLEISRLNIQTETIRQNIEQLATLFDKGREELASKYSSFADEINAKSKDIESRYDTLSQSKDGLENELLSLRDIIKERLDEIDINRVSPIEALNILYELKEMK